MNKKEIDFYEAIVIGAKMGVETLKILIPKCTSAALKKETERQHKEYVHIADKGIEKLHKLGADEATIPKPAEIMSKLNLELTTLFNKSDSHLAEKIMQGNLMGIIEISKLLNKNKALKDDEIEFANLFIDACETNLQSLKTFL